MAGGRLLLLADTSPVGEGTSPSIVPVGHTYLIAYRPLTPADGNREEHGRGRLGPHSRECMLQSAQGMSLFGGKKPLNDTASNVSAWEPQRHGGSARRDSSGRVDPKVRSKVG